MITMQRDRTSAAPADQMVESAVAYCAGKMFAGDTQRALQALHQGQCGACDYVRYSLARQVGDYLGQMDRTVKAVYVFETESAEIEETAAHRHARSSGINLIAWVDRKTAALSALSAALEVDLSSRRRAIGCANATPGCYLLDVYMVDDADVRERRGYGALVNGLHIRPIEVWSRA